MRLDALLERLSAIAPAFIDAALRGAVVLLVALVITHGMRRSSAAARHLVWVGAIVVQLALPLFAVWGPQWKVAVPDPVASVMPVDLHEAPAVPINSIVPNEAWNSTIPNPPVAAAAPATVASSRPSEPATSSISGRELLLALWVAGAAFILLRLAIGTTIVASLARKGNRIDDGNWLSLAQKLAGNLHIDRPLTLLRGDRLGVPVTWGIVYPVVLLPDDADAWPEERRRFVLVHEMAHVKRLDALTQLAGQLALALFWFDPLVWVANRRMQLEREHACDDYVLRHGTSASHYAEELLSMVRSIGTSDHRSAQPAFAALAMARRSEFEGRMLSILDPVLDRHPLSKSRAVASALVAMLLVVPLAALHPYQRAAAAPQPHPSTAAPKAPAAKPADDFPESFKVHIEPSGKGDSTRGAVTGMFGGSMFGAAASAITSRAATLAGATTTLAEKATTLKSPSCDHVKFGTATESASTHMHSDDDGGATIIDITKFNGARCSSATIVGTLKYNTSEDDILGMPFGSHASFRERTALEDRELMVLRSPDGTIEHQYRLNGQPSAFDASAQRWFGTYLPTVLAEAGLNVSPRIERWRAQGGLAHVLAEIAGMSSTSAKRAHYEALLAADKLSPDDMDRIVRSASETMQGSSGDLRAVLTAAAPRARLSKASMTAIEAALAGMASSGDKTAVLQLYGDTDDRDMLLSVMRASESIASSGDKARLHQVLMARYLANDDRVLHASFFDHAIRIPSSGDLRNTLIMAVDYVSKSPDIAKRIIEASRTVASSGDRSAVMIRLVSSGAVSTRELRDAFFSAAAEIPSEGDRSRVLQAAAVVK